MAAQHVTDATRSRRTVAAFPRLVEAQQVYSFLEGQKFPMARVRIVAEDLRPLVAPRSQAGRTQSALDGAVSGAVAGLLLVYALDVAGWMAPLVSGFLLGIGGLVFGLVAGAIVGLIVSAWHTGQHSSDAAAGFVAEHFSVMVDEEEADAATHLVRRVW
jgi:hypothetical protein